MVARSTLIALLLSAAACGRLGYEAIDAGSTQDGGGVVADGDAGGVDSGGGGTVCGDSVCSSGQRCCTGDGCNLCVDGRICPMISCGF